MRGRTLAHEVPNVEDLLSLAPEEVGALLLRIWPDGSEPFQTLFITPQHVVGSCVGGGSEATGYPPEKRRDIEVAVEEAFTWLLVAGLIIREPSQSAGFFTKSRRGKAIQTQDQLEAFKKAQMLPKHLLHTSIAAKIWPMFLRGEYEVAVFAAFKAVEVAVRDAAELPVDLLGVKLMRQAFRPGDGRLTDTSAEGGEQQALCDLFAGAIGHAKNPQSHRDKPVSASDAAQLLIFASYLLTVVELRRLLT
jgi:uncharacterized protein (TIGR02391 family)